MKPLISWNAIVVTTCLSAVGFFSGCATPKMEGQLLRQCIQRGDTDGAVKLVNSGVLDGKDNGAVYGDYLFCAAQKNDTNTLLALLAKGANIHYKQPGLVGVAPKRTAVHAAAQFRNVEALKILLEHGGSVLDEDAIYLTPFDLSVLGPKYEGPAFPAVVTDILIESGAKPREQVSRRWVFTTEAAAGTHWATGSYLERHGKISEAISSYRKAAQFYEQASRDALGLEKFNKFMNSPFMRSTLFATTIATGAAVSSSGGVVVYSDASSPFWLLDPKSAKILQEAIGTLHDTAEQYAAYSSLCANRADELNSQLRRE